VQLFLPFVVENVYSTHLIPFLRCFIVKMFSQVACPLANFIRVQPAIIGLRGVGSAIFFKALSVDCGSQLNCFMMHVANSLMCVLYRLEQTHRLFDDGFCRIFLSFAAAGLFSMFKNMGTCAALHLAIHLGWKTYKIAFKLHGQLFEFI